MGNIKTSFIKHIARDLFEKYAGKFAVDFEKNKQIIKGLIDTKSKRTRNVVAGYLTALKKQESKK